MKKKNIALLVSVVLLLCAAIGGTLAWLVADAGKVENTFAPSTISITLTETEPSNKTEIKMVPGASITKNPTVTVGANSEACYLYIQIEEKNNSLPYLTYELADGWTAVAEHPGYYRREVASSDANQSFEILKDNKVTVKDTVTNGQMADIADAANRPSLTFKAAAIQKDFIEADKIWAALPTGFTGE